MRAHDRRVEYLDEMRRRTHGCQSVEERLEDAGLAQPVEAFPHAVPRTEAIWQGAPPNILDGEEMERLEEAPVILGLPSPSRKAGAKHRKRVRPILIVHLRRHALRPPIRSETYESCPIQQRNPKNALARKFRPHGLAFTRACVHLRRMAAQAR